jgi:hypothetical protein
LTAINLAIQSVTQITADEIHRELQKLRQDEAALKSLLRSVMARERAQQRRVRQPKGGRNA